MTTPTAGSSELDLRVDIDPRDQNSPVMDRVSGDVYRVFQMRQPFRPEIRWRVYQYSWIVDSPQVTWFRCRVEITGTVRYWKGTHPATSVQVTIPWGTFTPAGPATVTFYVANSAIAGYSCTRRSACFRDVVLEADVCGSVNASPLLPSYDTHWHNARPAGVSQRVLTIEDAYREAGIGLTINPVHSTVDDSAPGFAAWSPAELHDAMETYFSQIGSGWPKWHLWGLLASRFDNAGVGGIMFDAAEAYGGAGEPPERQGFAVFRSHSWFDNLAAGTPANQDQAWAMRHYLYTWVHEAGHAFNLLHSWDKSRSDSLSWMNYDWKYDQRNGAGSFWSNFEFRFDDEELLHIRHGDRPSVIMGGDPWASGGHMESPQLADIATEGEAPVELQLRSEPYFEFMEPVTVELRLRNLLSDIPLTLDTRLHPDFGGVIFFIRRPDGRTLQYAPIMCKLGDPEMKTLQPSGSPIAGADRYSESIPLTYGAYGFYFDQPGDYLVRAVYQGAGDALIHSNVQRVRIGIPDSKEHDRLAQDIFTYEVGMSLYLDGSRSPYLKKGMDVLYDLLERSREGPLAAKIAGVLAQSAARSFYRISDAKKPALVKIADAEPQRALELTKSALSFYQSQTSKHRNLAYHELVSARAKLEVQTGQKAAAKEEVGSLLKDLGTRGVNKSVLEQIKGFQASL